VTSTRRTELPPELLGTPPRSLPQWARSRTLPVLLVAASVTTALVGLVVALQDGGALALIPFGFATVTVLVVLAQRANRRLLMTGAAAVGRVTGVSQSKGSVAVSYEYAGPSGLMKGSAGFDSMRVERAFGMWPEQNDAVFVVFDPARPTRSAVWGFAKR
jgi:hypothetical protein